MKRGFLSTLRKLQTSHDSAWFHDTDLRRIKQLIVSKREDVNNRCESGAHCEAGSLDFNRPPRRAIASRH